MDYFGILGSGLDKMKSYFEEKEEESQMKDEDLEPGDKCETEGCKNSVDSFGTYNFPYCQENLICIRKNMECLLLANALLRGRLDVYTRLFPKVVLETQTETPSDAE